MAIDKNVLDQLLAGRDPRELFANAGLLDELKKALSERILSAELDDHLAQEEVADRGNRRNGTSKKTVLTGSSQVTLDIPRDRAGTFDPKLIAKYQRRFPDVDDKIISMYARGMSVREILGHLEDLYGIDVSPDLISTVTDAVMETVTEWQGRPLDPCYPLVFFDAIRVKIRDEGFFVRNKAIYIALGILPDGTKDILGLWIEQTEGAKFWLRVMNEPKNRGIGDILIAVVDGLKGFPEAITAVFPQAIVQTCWCGRSHTASYVPTLRPLLNSKGDRPWSTLSELVMDTSKSVFQLHGVDGSEKPVIRKQLRRKEMIAFFEKLPSTVIAIEACGGSHHWARTLRELGHEVKLIPPQYVKPYVKRGKNDAADAEALCEAMSRPTMRFVPVKTAEQQAALMLVGVRDRLIRNRTQIANGIRGYAAEFGLIAAKGMCRIEALLERISADQTLPTLARDLFALHAQEYAQLQEQLKVVEDKLTAWHRADERSRRLAQIPGVGPLGASLLLMKTPAPNLFQPARHFAAWLGLTPKDHSTAGKVRLGVITRPGDEALRSTLIVGATALVQHVRAGRSKNATPWLLDLLKRKAPKLVAVAVANKIARIAWRLMVSGDSYRGVAAGIAPAGVA